jgi:hypothetical protein
MAGLMDLLRGGGPQVMQRPLGLPQSMQPYTPEGMGAPPVLAALFGQGQAVQAPQGAPMPQMAPQGQPMPQQAPQPMPQSRGGGFGEMLGNLLNPGQSGRNQTEGWLQSQGLDPGTARIVASDKGLLQKFLLDKQKGVDPLEVEYKRAQIDNMRSQIDERKNPNMRNQYGNSIIWAKKRGKWVAMQPSSGGGLVAADVPEDIELVPPGVTNLDLGNQYGIRDRAGDLIGTVDKNLADAESDKVAGKAQGEAIATYRSMMSKMPGVESVVSELGKLSEKATYTMGGRLLDEGRKQLGMDPREAAVARAQYIAMVDNQVLPLLRDTFGAQFTQAEGQTLRMTLGDPDKSPSEKQAVLTAFIEQKRRDIEAYALQSLGGAGQQQPGAPMQGGGAPQGGTPQRLRFNPETGDFE